MGRTDILSLCEYADTRININKNMVLGNGKSEIIGVILKIFSIFAPQRSRSSVG